MGHEKHNVEAVRRDRERRYGTHLKTKPLFTAKESRALREDLHEGIWGIIKLFFTVFFIWPIKLFWWIISTPFKLMGALYRSKAPLAVKIILTIIFVIFLLFIVSYFTGQSNT